MALREAIGALALIGFTAAAVHAQGLAQAAQKAKEQSDATAGRGTTVTKLSMSPLDGDLEEIQLTNDVSAYLRASEISRDRVEDARNVLKEGDDVQAMIVNIDRKNRSMNLSIKAKDSVETAEAMQRIQAESGAASGTTNLGALLRAKLDTPKE